MSAKDIENQMNEFREFLLQRRLFRIYKEK